jgi:hypothetical protein
MLKPSFIIKLCIINEIRNFRLAERSVDNQIVLSNLGVHLFEVLPASVCVPIRRRSICHSVSHRRGTHQCTKEDTVRKSFTRIAAMPLQLEAFARIFSEGGAG